MIRRVDWPERLAAHIVASSARPFAWGSFDCCTFACDAVVATTDVDPMAELRGTYDDVRSAAVALRKFAGGLDETAEKIAAILGAPSVPLAFAQRGDVVLGNVETDDGAGLALGIVGLDGRATFAGKIGLTRIDVRDCVKAWSVG